LIDVSGGNDKNLFVNKQIDKINNSIFILDFDYLCPKINTCVFPVGSDSGPLEPGGFQLKS